ncbi:unnamed protein product [Linum trigynum]|uniref:Sieve element occlusion C-terminal domain-containing protein n=1 Tax=Linum trigynum TaxID=586398 RepID=A0AAV2GT75_9ROSI
MNHHGNTVRREEQPEGESEEEQRHGPVREPEPCVPDFTLIWFFLVRLESMWHSKVQYNKTVENDAIMQAIVTMLSFDGSEQGWVVVSRASAGMTKAPEPGKYTGFAMPESEWIVRVFDRRRNIEGLQDLRRRRWKKEGTAGDGRNGRNWIRGAD